MLAYLLLGRLKLGEANFLFLSLCFIWHIFLRGIWHIRAHFNLQPLPVTRMSAYAKFV